jgi:hypothetical protein
MADTALPPAPFVRACKGCDQIDNHPRHVFQGEEIGWHMDCHAIKAGCEICAHQIKDAKGKKGDELRAHLLHLRARGLHHPGQEAVVEPGEGN